MMENRRQLAALTGLVLGLVVVLSLSGRLLGRGPPLAPFPQEVGFLAAFLGGFLALLSPCSGAILPAFFAYSFRDQGRLVPMTYVFYLGLATVFVPLGFATSLVGAIFAEHASTIFLLGGLLLIGMDLASVFSLELPKVLNLGGRVAARMGPHARLGQGNDIPRVYAMGVVFGFATSSCTAPIVGAIQMVALGAGLDSFRAILLFMVFALGIVVPLFALAFVFDRHGVGRRWRGRTFHLRLGAREAAFHSTKVATGVVLVALGAAFIGLRGTLDLTGTFVQVGAADLSERLNLAVLEFAETTPGQVVSVAALVLAAAAAWRRVRRPRTTVEETAAE